MKILLVSSYLPYPLHSGGHIRLYNILKVLSKHYKITLVCEKRVHQTIKDIEEVEKFCQKVITIERKRQWSLQNIARSSISTMPFLVVGHTVPEMKASIVQLLTQETFDLIHIETFYVFQNIPKTYLPTVLVEHNIEYLVYKRYLQTLNPLAKPILLADVLKIKIWEERFWKKATRLVAVSEEEKSIMEKVREDVSVVPNGVDTKSFTLNPSRFMLKKKEKRVLFIGDFKWIQNRKSVVFILKEVWPLITMNYEPKTMNLKLWIVGKHIPENLKQLGLEDSSIVFDENAPDDTAKIYQKADILLAPIVVGGGTSYKILEAMASGVPVVTTPRGILGLNAKHKQDALVATTSSQIAEHVISLIEKPEIAEKIAKNAREFVEKNYNWEKITGELEGVYKKAIEE